MVNDVSFEHLYNYCEVWGLLLYHPLTWSLKNEQEKKLTTFLKFKDVTANFKSGISELNIQRGLKIKNCENWIYLNQSETEKIPILEGMDDRCKTIEVNHAWHTRKNCWQSCWNYVKMKRLFHDQEACSILHVQYYWYVWYRRKIKKHNDMQLIYIKKESKINSTQSWTHRSDKKVSNF